MAGMKFDRFLGLLPRVPPSLLPGANATIAENCDFAYGELRNTRGGLEVTDTMANAPATVYTDDGLRFYTWDEDVDVVRSPLAHDIYDRIYYTTASDFRVAPRAGMSPNGGPPPVSYRVGVPRPSVPPRLALGPTASLTGATFSFSSFFDSGTPGSPKMFEQAETELAGSAVGAWRFKWRPNPITNHYPKLDQFPGTGMEHDANNVPVFYKDDSTGKYYVWVDFLLAYLPVATWSETAQLIYRVRAVAADGVTVIFDAYTPGSSFNNPASAYQLALTSEGITHTTPSGTTWYEPTIAIVSLTDHRTGTDSDQTRVYVYTYVNVYGEESAPSSPASITVTTLAKVSVGLHLDVEALTPYAPLREIRIYRTSGTTSASYFYAGSVPASAFGVEATFLLHLCEGIVSAIYPVLFGRVVDAGGLTFWSKTLAQGVQLSAAIAVMMNSEEYKNSGRQVALIDVYRAVVTSLYQQLFGRAPDAGGLAFYADSLFKGYSLFSTMQALMTSAEYVHLRGLDGLVVDFTFVDTSTASTLNEPLSSTFAVAPDPLLVGLLSLPNGILMAFKDNELHFSDPYKPWSWPPAYVLTVSGRNIVGTIPSGTGALVTTTGQPFFVSGVSPDSMTQSVIMADQAGVSKWALANVGDAIVYASHDGLVMVSGGQASMAMSETYFTRDTWRRRFGLGLDSMRMAVWDGRLIVYSSEDKFPPMMLSIDEATGAMTDLPLLKARCHFVSPIADQCFFALGTSLFQFMAGDPEGPLLWQSREIVLPRPINLGCMQVLCVGDWTVEVFAYDRETGGVFEGMQRKHIQSGLSGQVTFTLPSGFTSDRWQFRISGMGIFRELRVATSMFELRGL
jgi:hypothetical protein